MCQAARECDSRNALPGLPLAQTQGYPLCYGTALACLRYLDSTPQLLSPPQLLFRLCNRREKFFSYLGQKMWHKREVGGLLYVSFCSFWHSIYKTSKAHGEEIGSAILVCCTPGEVIIANEIRDSSDVIGKVLRKCESDPHQPGDTLPRCAVETFDVIGCAGSDTTLSVFGLVLLIATLNWMRYGTHSGQTSGACHLSCSSKEHHPRPVQVLTAGVRPVRAGRF